MNHSGLEDLQMGSEGSSPSRHSGIYSSPYTGSFDGPSQPESIAGDWTVAADHGRATSSSMGSICDSDLAGDGFSRKDHADTRVLLRMEVPHKEHAALIGAGGSRVREMQEESSCQIHYPDSGELLTGDEFARHRHSHLHLNEVSIRGKLANVIAGYQEVRTSIPFQFSVLLKVTPNMQVIAALEKQFAIEVTFKTVPRGKTQMVIRGPQTERTLVGVGAVCRQFSDPDGDVSQTLCIHPHSQSSMWEVCDAEYWLTRVAKTNGVTIVFPSPRGNDGDKETVTISGSVRGVATAWIYLMSLLPVAFRIFISEDLDYMKFEHYITKELNVGFLVPRRERRRSDRQYIELKSFEGNIENICNACHVLIGADPHHKFRVISTAEKLSKLGLSVKDERYGQNSTGLNGHGANRHMHGTRSTMNRCAVPSPFPVMVLPPPCSPFPYHHMVGPSPYPYPMMMPPYVPPMVPFGYPHCYPPCGMYDPRISHRPTRQPSCDCGRPADEPNAVEHSFRSGVRNVNQQKRPQQTSYSPDLPRPWGDTKYPVEISAFNSPANPPTISSGANPLDPFGGVVSELNEYFAGIAGKEKWICDDFCDKLGPSVFDIFTTNV